MNDPTFEYHPDALLEAWKARQWYAERDYRAAAAFVAELDEAQARLTSHPDRWPIYIDGTRRYRLRRFPYLLVYVPAPRRILVLAVAHLKRRPGYWKARRAP
jgi:plasmid stabilization system protein ParE